VKVAFAQARPDFRTNGRYDLRGKAYEFTPESKLIVASSVNANDFERELRNFNFIEEKFSIHIGAPRWRQSERGALVNYHQEA
jgi:hypothetical protein